MNRTSLKKAAIITTLVLVAIVVFQNTESVETKMFLAKATMPLALLLFLTFTLGATIGWLLGKRKKSTPTL
ncbi:MAG: DUF1049 domain-containing protein [Planctomycetes bacterium]|nr:DUF1049 domain-containing protein [Planctomycetota bacterium]HPF14379.1 lipopolysaccharide assembly protein LapA domain-containing protein [Planctomycetota bacterium]